MHGAAIGGHPDLPKTSSSGETPTFAFWIHRILPVRRHGSYKPSMSYSVECPKWKLASRAQGRRSAPASRLAQFQQTILATQHSQADRVAECKAQADYCTVPEDPCSRVALGLFPVVAGHVELHWRESRTFGGCTSSSLLPSLRSDDKTVRSSVRLQRRSNLDRHGQVSGCWFALLRRPFRLHPCLHRVPRSSLSMLPR